MSYYDANHYQAVELETRTRSASPYELVLVLYDGLLDELARARGHIEAKQYQQKGRSLEKCIKILNGLNAALDYDNGGELIAGLGQLYEYCIRRIAEISISLEVEGIDEVTHLLTTLREGWQGVQEQRHGI